MSLLWVACISAPFVEEDEWRFKDTLLLAVSFPFWGDGGACFMSCCLWIKLLPQCQLCASQCTATAAAKSLQSCPTLCDPIDGSPPGSPIPGILQARTLEWVAISFFNAWKWKWKWSRSVLSDFWRPHGLQPTRLLHPWDFPGKSTGVGCHCLLCTMY